MKIALLSLFLGLFYYSHGQADTLLVFQFDDSNNQIERKFIIKDEQGNIVDRIMPIIEPTHQEQFFTVYPNPTAGITIIGINQEIKDEIVTIHLFSPNGVPLPLNSYSLGDESIQLDLSKNISGAYQLVALLNNGRKIYTSIVKL